MIKMTEDYVCCMLVNRFFIRLLDGAAFFAVVSGDQHTTKPPAGIQKFYVILVLTTR